MPLYTNTVPTDPRGPALPIKRTPASTPLVAIITSPDLIGCYTHYWKGRTMPCEKPDCEPCQNGIPYRWHAYQAALDTKNHLHFIFECTAQAAEPFIDYRTRHNTLRGCAFEARRLNNRPNGRILIRTKPADLSNFHLPNAPDLEECLAILWSLPRPSITTPHRNPEKRTQEATIQPRKDPANLDFRAALTSLTHNPPNNPPPTA